MTHKDRNKRISATQALTHPFFESYQENKITFASVQPPIMVFSKTIIKEYLIPYPTLP